MNQNDATTGSRSCRFCGNSLTTTFVDLGMSPLCQTHVDATHLGHREIFYPLHAYVCDRCFLVQLGEFATPEEIFTEITQDYQRVFGPHLISIILYGSGAGEDYLPGKSDLNFLITLTDQGIERLDLAIETVARWRKRNVAIPFFMTRSWNSRSEKAAPSLAW